jgi:hypothetical protein
MLFAFSLRDAWRMRHRIGAFNALALWFYARRENARFAKVQARIEIEDSQRGPL